MSSLADELRNRLLPILVGQAFGFGCGIAGVALSSHWVTPRDYGNFGVFLTFVPLGATVIFTGRIKYVSRYWHGAQSRPALWRSALSGAGGLLLWLAFAVVTATATFAPSHQVVYGISFLVSAVALVFLQFVQSALQAERSHWRDTTVGAIASVTRSFIPPIAYHATGAGLPAVLGGFALHAVATAIAAAWLVRSWWRSDANDVREVSPKQIYQGAAFVGLAIAAWILVSSNRWIVAGFFGPERAGYFVLAAAIGGLPVTMLGSVLLQYLQPLWFARASRGPKMLSQVDWVAMGYIASSVALAGVVAWLAPGMIALGLIGERYASIAMFVLPAGCAAAAVNAGNFYHAMLMAWEEERACIRVDLTGIVVLIGGSVTAATVGLDWLLGWLTVSPLVPLLVNRTLARRAIAGARPAA